MPSPDKDENGKLDSILKSLADEAEQQAQSRDRSASGQKVQVRVDTASDHGLATVTVWLDGRNVSYRAYTSSGQVYAFMPTTLLSDLAALDGVVRVRKQNPPKLP